jgi:hypothetical protein
MAIILKANKVNLFVPSVLFVFWYHLRNVLDTPRINTLNLGAQNDRHFFSLASVTFQFINLPVCVKMQQKQVCVSVPHNFIVQNQNKQQVDINLLKPSGSFTYHQV